MSAPIPRFVVVRAAATILGSLLVAAGVFFAILYFQRQSETQDRLEAQREEIAQSTSGGSKDSHDPQRTKGEPKMGAVARPKKEKAPRLETEAQKAMTLAKQKEAEYEKLYSELEAAGMVRSATLPNLESISERKETLARLEASNLALAEALNVVRENALAEYRKQGKTERELSQAMAASPGGAQLNALIAIRAVDRELIGYFKQLLDLLENDWGAWKPDAADKVLFDKQAEANRYNALRGRIVEASNRQHALQQDAATKAPTPTPSVPQPAMRYDPAFIGPPSNGEIPIERGR